MYCCVLFIFIWYPILNSRKHCSIIYSCFYVIDPPFVTVNETIKVPNGSVVVILCDVSGNPPPDIFWYEGKNVSDGRLINHEKRLSIKVVSNETYICSANNSLGSVTARVDVVVGKSVIHVQLVVYRNTLWYWSIAKKLLNIVWHRHGNLLFLFIARVINVFVIVWLLFAFDV